MIIEKHVLGMRQNATARDETRPQLRYRDAVDFVGLASHQPMVNPDAV